MHSGAPTLAPDGFPDKFRWHLPPDFNNTLPERWARFRGRSERLQGAVQIAAPGYVTPIKARLSKPAWFFRSGPLENVRLRFTAVSPDGKTYDLGSAVTDALGEATVYFSADTPGDYRMVAVREDGGETAVCHGLLSVISQDKPVVVLDVDEMIRKHGFKAAAATLSGDSPTFRVVGMTLHENTAQGLRDVGVIVPVIVNDYKDSPFPGTGRGFAETQVEKLKRLKFENGVPVVGVVTRRMQSVASFHAAGIYPTVPEGGHELHDLENSVIRDFLLACFADFTRSLTKTKEEFYWDGMTQSAMIYGNHIRFFTGNSAAAGELDRLLEGAKTFIHASTFGMLSDRFGRKIFAKLIEKSRAGISDRLIIDRMTQGPFPTDNGFTWLDFSTVFDLMRAGAQIVYHHIFHPEDSDQARRGPLVRRHRKNVIVDYADADTPRQILAYGGGRVIGSVGYEDLKYDANRFQKFLGIGWGTFRDLNFTIAGPAAGRINRKFMEDFRDYGGILSANEFIQGLGPTPRQPQNTGLRPIYHDSYFNQNAHDVLVSFLKRPESRDITFINSFMPSEVNIDAMITAARNGKKVRWIVSAFWWDFAKRRKLIPKMISAGVEVVMVPYQLHTKLYFNEHYYAFGNQNLDKLSQHDAEDLIMMPRDGGEDARALSAYVVLLLRDGINISRRFAPDAAPADIMAFIDTIENTDPPNVTRFGEHSFAAGVVRAILFIALSPFRWRAR